MSRVKKVPVILQMEALECGAASLGMILEYYGKHVPLEKLRIDCNVSRDGSNAKYIILAAQFYGLKGKAYRMGAERIRQYDNYPVVIHWNFNHFVVLCGFKRNGDAVINDPACGRTTVSKEEFDRAFTGIVMSFDITEAFERGGERYNLLRFIRKRSAGLRLPLIFVTSMGLLSAFLYSLKPGLYKMFTDRILIGKDTFWMKYILAGMLGILVFGFVFETLQDTYLSRIKAKISADTSAEFMWHVLRLPVEFFSQRFTGDIVSRLKSNNEIAYTLCTGIFPVGLNCAMILVYLIYMIAYDPGLTCIGVGAAVIDIVVIRMTSRYIVNNARNSQRDMGKLSGMTSACIYMMETIKSSGAEHGFFQKISGYQAKYNNSVQDSRNVNVYMNAIPVLLSSLAECAVMLIGVYNIFSGKFTIGMLMAFQGFVGSFMSPVTSLVSSMQSYQEMNGMAERVDDVLNYKTDIDIRIPGQEMEYLPLTGEVEFCHVDFAYSKAAPPVISDFNLKVPKGCMVALVGGSGSGKSTLAKIMSGLYRPLAGQITFDGRTIDEIDRNVFTNSLAVVDQNISMFEGTVRENISMWDVTMSEQSIIRACQDACIHDDIMSRKGGYDYVISEGGSNFSGGQRQKLEIARALAIEPSIIILDEATSALDTEAEKKVMDAIRKRNITCFVIAHRLSTIRDADIIIYLDRGKEVERGTHNELICLNGRYAGLVKNE